MRARTVRNKGFVRTYDPQESEKLGLRLYLKSKKPPYFESVPLKVEVVFVMPISLTLNKKRRQMAINGSLYHIKRPDIDNLIKFIYDVCNGIVWKDDSQVVDEYAKKVYGEVSRTLLWITVLENEELAP